MINNEDKIMVNIDLYCSELFKCNFKQTFSFCINLVYRKSLSWKSM